jgi:hypothetical protein
MFQGTCKLCGKDNKALRDVFGKRMCSECERITWTAYNNPELLIQFIIEAKGRDWLVESLKLTGILSTNVLGLEGVIAAKNIEIKALKEEIDGMDSITINLEKTAKAQAEEVKILTTFAVSNAKALAIAKAANSDMLARNSALSEEAGNLKTRIADLLEQNRNLEQERFNLSVQVERLNASAAATAKNVPVPFAGSIPFDPDNEAQLAIVCACEKLCAMLIQKNTAYGNSALEPLRLFSKASPREQLLVRIDDKLSRLDRGGEFPGDDTIVDLAGYLVLLLAHDSLAV